MNAASRPAFSAYGVEIEYMIVDRESLDVRPVCDRLFAAAGAGGAELGDWVPDGPDGAIALSNELALHVLEFKTNGPASDLESLAATFHGAIRRVNALLAAEGAMLLPGGMHPWMDPDRETKLWPHECGEIYRAYDRIFDCRGHGWSNLQSTHLNLPFANDEEFGRLHLAIRALLPLLPALTAASPLVDGQWSSLLDHRLEVYRHNARRVPEMAGLVVPEPVTTRAAYEKEILGRLYDALAPHDPEGLLRFEFANARGAIARFDRGAIEIRVLDTQESPRADLALLELVVAAVRALYEERFASLADLAALETERLAVHFLDLVRDAEQTWIADDGWLAVFGLPPGARTAREVWRHLRETLLPARGAQHADLDRLLAAGSLASRLRHALRGPARKEALLELHRELAEALRENGLFRA